LLVFFSAYLNPPSHRKEQLMATAIDFNCIHCGTSVSHTEIKDGWCDSCGKKIPYSVQSAAKKAGTPVKLKDDYDEPKPGSGRRLLVSALVFVSLFATAAVFILRNA
jgi:hypothetical protein